MLELFYRLLSSYRAHYVEACPEQGSGKCLAQSAADTGDDDYFIHDEGCSPSYALETRRPNPQCDFDGGLNDHARTVVQPRQQVRSRGHFVLSRQRDQAFGDLCDCSRTWHVPDGLGGSLDGTFGAQDNRL